MNAPSGRPVMAGGHIVEVESEPSAEMFVQHGSALTGLLRMALLSGAEMTLPTALQLVLDSAQAVVTSEAQVITFNPAHAPEGRHTLTHGVDRAVVPDDSTLNLWAKLAAKPVIVERGLDAQVDGYLDRLHAQYAAAVPLFVQHDWAGSLQLFRNSGPRFSETEARLLWILSLLAENQIGAIESMRQLVQLASTDYLTGQRARGYFERALEQEVHRSLRRSSPCGLLLLDLDNFKSVNDHWGHHAGDEVLRQFAQILPLGLREVDTVARFGGDEFALILPDTGRDGLDLVARRMCEQVEQHNFAIQGTNLALHLSLSLGLAICPDHARTSESLLRTADAELYKVKRQKRPLWSGLQQAG
ncbi:MAG: GGDEF domain-containing protein [Terriglobales bacterium]